LGFKSVERKKKVLGLKNIGKIMCLAEIVKCKIGNLSILLKVDHETLMHPYETLLADVMYDAMHMQCLINAA
jgi:hypothetical protein